MHTAGSATDGSKPRILLIEDESVLREHIAEALADEYTVETAANGREALRAVLDSLPELIVTDIVMPDVDGIEMLKALRSTRRTQGIPVLLTSGHAIDEQRIEAFRIGADGFLAKPFTERELRIRIGSMLRSLRYREEVARELAGEQALAERAALLDSITDAFYALDAQFRFTYLNRRALEHFGRPREALLGRVMWDVIPMARGTLFEHEYKRALREQSSVAFETASVISDLWVAVRAYPTPDGIAVYFHDISDRKRAEEQLREADRRKTEFLAVLAHELRNPLAPLRNGLHILRHQCGPDAAITRTVSMMDRQMTHLVRLVDDLLDVSRITRGSLLLRREKVLLSSVLASAVEACRTLIERLDHELVLDMRFQTLVIDGDPERLTQVFTNLLSNSAKYTNCGGRIALTVDREEDEAVIRIEDTGIGIPSSALEQVFEMFAQVRSDEGRFTDGLGIGLSLVRSLVEKHGGTVRAFSDGPGRGSRFVVRLPIAEELDATTEGAAPALVRTRAMRILVVDDNADAAGSLALLLQMEGHEVRTAADGEDGVEQARAFEPEVIFMDLGMPRLDGFEAARRIRALAGGEKVRIIALTGWGQESDRERTRDAGIDHHLIKPVSLEALHKVVDAVSHGRSDMVGPTDMTHDA
jgi:PAS domain S-box-containing protein